jgi:hypothetical protein
MWRIGAIRSAPTLHRFKGFYELIMETNRSSSPLGENVSPALETRESVTPNFMSSFFVDDIPAIDFPGKPIEPTDQDCCMSGCAICVWDVYREELETWKQRAKMAGVNIAQESPLDAFLELEKSLEARKSK